MKKISLSIKLTICGILCIAIISCASKGSERVSLDPLSQKFLDVVSYIILPVEDKIFHEMPLEDRGEFIKDFWERRDPDPSTSINEFRQTYYQRLAIADKAFKAGKPGWKTDRGRTFILLGPPTNVISKAMGSTPYDPQKFLGTNPLEAGTLTERPTEIWVYDHYTEHFQGPLRLVFVDVDSTRDYKLQTAEEIKSVGFSSWTMDEPNLTKYQWVGEVEMDKLSRVERGIFDYEASIKIIKEKETSSVAILIRIPYIMVDYREERENYSFDLLISAEVRDSQKKLLTRQEEPLIQTHPAKRLRSMVANDIQIQKEWELDLPPGSHFIYISVTDNVRGKRLRKLLEIQR